MTYTSSYEPAPTYIVPTSSAWTTTGTIASSTISIQPSTISETPTSLSTDSGSSNNNKVLIGGVVGGIGGAVIIGAVAFFLIMRWKKNRRASDRESFHPQADPEMSDTRNTGEYSYYNSITNLSRERIVSSQPGRY